MINSSNNNIINGILFVSSVVAISLMILRGAEPESTGKVIGTIATIAVLFSVLYFFLLQFRSEVLQITRKTVFILISITGLLLFTKYVSGFKVENALLIVPFAIIPVVIRTFYDARLALFVHLITLMTAGFIVDDPYRLIFVNFVTGMVAIFTLKNTYRKIRLLFTALMVTAAHITLYFCLLLVSDGMAGANILDDLRLIIFNGVLVLLSYPVILLFEMEFLFLSDNTLLELTDFNQPLLRKMAAEAPGSYQHSLQVANLAEEAARVIGSNSLLVRAGALYHDIGKVANPMYFTENQVDGSNPHSELSPVDSSRLIINHVKNGIVLAKNFKLPSQVIDFIKTHHGTSVAYFFYKKYLDQNPGASDFEREFAYPGPKPFSKETAIVMMADAIEASSRSLQNYDDESIKDLVERIIYLQEQDGQFSNVPLTYKDISDIKEVFRKRLSTIYHTRIAYPERD